MYHGAKRTNDPHVLAEADVIITTFSIVENEYRNHVAAPKVACVWCERKFADRYKLDVHLKVRLVSLFPAVHRVVPAANLCVCWQFFCGPDAQKSEKQAKQRRKNPGGWGKGKGKGKGKGGKSKIVVAEVSSSADAIDLTDDNNEPQEGASSSAGSGWACPACTLANVGSASICDVCSTARPGGADADSGDSGGDEAEDSWEEAAEQEQNEPRKGEKEAKGSGKRKRAPPKNPFGRQPRKPRGPREPRKPRKKRGGSNSDDEDDSDFDADKHADDNNENDNDDGVDMELPPRQRAAAKGKRPAARPADGDGGGGGDEDPNTNDDDDDAPLSDRKLSADIAADKKGAAKIAKQALANVRDTPAFGAALHKVAYYRIVLDEAHCIKDRASGTAKAVFHLTSEVKWCLSGTPLQNRVSELYSLIRFLQIDPYAYYFCNKANIGGCDCKSLKFEFVDFVCQECNHSRRNHFCSWNKQIANPIKNDGFGTLKGQHAMRTLKVELLDKMCLRRTKAQKAEDIVLPPRDITMRFDSLDEHEEDYYTALYTQTQTVFGDFAEEGTVLNNYAHIFDLLIRLRQAVDHPYLVQYSATQMQSGMGTELQGDDAAAGSADAQGGASSASEAPLAPAASSRQVTSPVQLSVVCGICTEETEERVEAECGHAFCRCCVEDFISTQETAARCPSCERNAATRGTLMAVDLTPSSSRQSSGGAAASSPPAAGAGERAGAVAAASGGAAGGAASGMQHNAQQTSLLRRKTSILKRIPDLGCFRTSTKIEALLEEVTQMRARDPSAKAICFSQFVNMLDLIEWRTLRASDTGELGVKIGVLKYDGRMSVKQKENVLNAFQSDPSVNLLLISLKAGGVGLNLTAASHVFLMDPWWNPATEMQAMDRIHRIGQTRPIRVVRFFIKNTIEDRILRLQEKKRLVFEGTVGNNSAAMAKLTADDLRFLFA